MIRVIPFMSPSFDIGDILFLTQNLLGRSLTQNFGKHNIDVYQKKDELKNFIALLVEADSENSNPLLAIETAGDLVKHSFFGFFILCPTTTAYSIIERIADCIGLTALKTSKDGWDLLITSGTLLGWREALVNLLMSDKTKETGTLLFEVFEQNGLAKIWSGLIKRDKNTVYLPKT